MIMDIILFGASGGGIKAFDRLSAIDGLCVRMFADNDVTKVGGFLCGVPIVSLDEVVTSNYTVVIACDKYVDVAEQLDTYGLDYYINVKEFLCEHVNQAEAESTHLFADGQRHYLVICNSGYGDQIISGFVWARVVSYCCNGLNVDVFAISKIAEKSLEISRREGINVYQGDLTELTVFLKRNSYHKLMIHSAWGHIMFHIRRAQVTTPNIIWVHGDETESWRRREFYYMEELEKDTAEYQQREAILDERDLSKLKLFSGIYSDSGYKFVFVSEWIRNVAEEDCHCKVANCDIIPNFIDSGIFSFSEKHADQRKKTLLIKSFDSNTYANDIAVKTILRLSEYTQFSDMEFFICGDGKLYDKVMAPLLARSFTNVKMFRGFLSHAQIAELHKEYGVFLNATRHDTQNVSMCEAMSSGLVVITNRVGGVPEYIDNSTGFLCDLENYSQMAEALLHLYDNPDIFMQMSKRAAERVASQCGFDATIRRELSLIKDGVN